MAELVEAACTKLAALLVEYQMETEDYQVNRRADAVVKLIFALHWAAGAYANRIQVELKEQPSGGWHTVLSFAYED